MGYWGTILLTRSPVRVTELPSLDTIAVRHKRLRELGDGWQLLETSTADDPPYLRECVDALVARWAAPVLASYVTDGDCAGVYAAAPGGAISYLHLPDASATSCEDQPIDLPVPTLDRIRADAAAWATAAGLTLSTRRLDRILDYSLEDPGTANYRFVPADELVYELVRALGFETIPWPLPYRLDPEAPPFDVVVRNALVNEAYAEPRGGRAAPVAPQPWKSAAIQLEKDIFNSMFGGPHTPADLARRVGEVYRAALASGDPWLVERFGTDDYRARVQAPIEFDDDDPPYGVSFYDGAAGPGLWPDGYVLVPPDGATHPDDESVTVAELTEIAAALPDEADRVSALIGLLPSLRVLSYDSVADLIHLTDDVAAEVLRMNLLTAVLPRATQSHVHEIYAALRALELPRPAAEGLRRVLPRLDGETAAGAVDELLNLVEAADGEQWIEEVFGGLDLSDAHRCRLADICLAITDPVERAGRVAGLIGLFPSGRRREAIASVVAVTHEPVRGVYLGRLAPHLTGADLEFLERAAYAIDEGLTRVRVLAALVPHLPEPRRQEAVEAALTLITSPGWERKETFRRSIACDELLPVLDPGGIGRLMDAEAARPPDDRFGLGVFAPYAPPERLEAELDALVVTGRAVSARRPWKAHGIVQEIVRIVPYLPAGKRPAAIRAALELDGGTAPSIRGFVVDRAAAEFTPDLSRDALRMAASRPEEFASAVGVLAPHLDEATLAETLATARAITDEEHREEALGGLVPYLPPDDLVGGVVDDAVALASPGAQAAVLVTILSHAPARLRARVTTATELAIARLTRASTQAACLVNLAAAQQPDQRAGSLRRAVNAVLAMPPASTRADLLIAIAELLPNTPTAVDPQD
jgi:hypothetical protein